MGGVDPRVHCAKLLFIGDRQSAEIGSNAEFRARHINIGYVVSILISLVIHAILAK
jgi:hypothetical protein